MDIRQLKFFVACARAGSISEAARMTYATQSTVSKAIKSMEETMGIRLFDRLPRGITLTAQGERVYRQACKIVNELDALEKFPKTGEAKWIRISLNPSSWFADQFVQFYNETCDRNYHYQIYTAGVETVVDRIRDYLDDVGFVYIFEQQKEAFFSELTRKRLSFTLLQECMMRVYPGEKNRLNKKKEDTVSLEELSGEHFIQNYQDEYISMEKEGSGECFSWKNLDVTVVTNSDYIMDKMLRSGDILNISGSYLSKDENAAYGKELLVPENRIWFGYIMRKEEEPEEGVQKLISYLKQKLTQI